MEKNPVTIFIRGVSWFLVVVAILWSFGMAWETVDAGTKQGFETILGCRCSCQQDAWIYQSQSNYLIYSGGFLVAFLVCAALAIRSVIKPSLVVCGVALILTVTAWFSFFFNQRMLTLA